MGTEIERKFMVIGDSWCRQVTRKVEIIQGYIARGSNCTVRIRIAGETARITVKGKSTHFTRAEYEYPIPVEDARQMLDTFAPDRRIYKTRNFLIVDGAEWVVDEFHDTNHGLIMAEIELSAEDTPISIPAWLGQEVSTDQRFGNAYLVEHPYSGW